eukprot:749085-Hanusia_phi.AAC.1
MLSDPTRSAQAESSPQLLPSFFFRPPPASRALPLRLPAVVSFCQVLLVVDAMTGQEAANLTKVVKL